MQILIRRAEPRDAEGLAALHVRAWLWAYRGILPAEYLAAISIERRRANWTAALQEGRASRQSWLAEDEGGHVVGFVTFGLSRDTDAGGRTGEVMGIYLDESAAGQGVGCRLMNHALTDLKTAGFKEVTLWVLRDNGRARTFYEKMGFIPDGAAKSEERPGAVLHEVRYRRSV